MVRRRDVAMLRLVIWWNDGKFLMGRAIPDWPAASLDNSEMCKKLL
ncbi:hypothetical protein [Fischerella thermalis]|nr:hypothetical protein [Fischerella thermalis]